MNRNLGIVLILALLQSSLGLIKKLDVNNVPNDIPLAQGDVFEVASDTYFDMSQADLSSTNMILSQGP